jgi:hypothetical protein
MFGENVLAPTLAGGREAAEPGVRRGVTGAGGPAEAELARVIEAWNRTDASVPRDPCIRDLFAAPVARTLDAVAVLHEGAPLTYAGLEAQANRIAHRQRSVGVPHRSLLRDQRFSKPKRESCSRVLIVWNAKDPDRSGMGSV